MLGRAASTPRGGRPLSFSLKSNVFRRAVLLLLIGGVLLTLQWRLTSLDVGRLRNLRKEITRRMPVGTRSFTAACSEIALTPPPNMLAGPPRAEDLARYRRLLHS